MTAGRSRPKTGAALRALVTDVDGTLTDAHRRLDLAAVRLVQEVQASGRPVVLATGNVLPIALALYRSIGLTGPIVAENGGLLYWRQDGRDHVEKLLDRRVALAAYRRVVAAGLPVRRLFTDRWRESEVALEPGVPPAQVRAAVGDLPVDVEFTGYALHLIARGGGKVPALRRALAPHGLTLADCLVTGDGDNDVPMLRAAGFGASFANGSARARAAADYVARAGYAAGFREAIKRSRVLVS